MCEWVSQCVMKVVSVRRLHSDVSVLFQIDDNNSSMLVSGGDTEDWRGGNGIGVVMVMIVVMVVMIVVMVVMVMVVVVVKAMTTTR